MKRVSKKKERKQQGKKKNRKEVAVLEKSLFFNIIIFCLSKWTIALVSVVRARALV